MKKGQSHENYLDAGKLTFTLKEPDSSAENLVLSFKFIAG